MFPKNCQNFWSNLDDPNKMMLQKVVVVYIKVFRIQTTCTKGLKGFKIIPSNNSCWSMMFIPFFSNLIVKGSQVFDYRGIMWVRNMEGILNLLKSILFLQIVPKRAKMVQRKCSRWSLIYSKLKHGGSKFFYRGKNGAPEIVGWE